MTVTAFTAQNLGRALMCIFVAASAIQAHAAQRSVEGLPATPVLSPLPVAGGDAVKLSKQRAQKGDFDAEILIPCAQELGQNLGSCNAAVARAGQGAATVVVTFPNGFARKLYFTEGAFTSASATMSGAGRDTDWSLQGDLFQIRVDDQRYEIPESFVLGN
ncbi:hypothetical protein [Shimia sp.]|uniref:hypothetical protein n=1 Tax=Shimia sp. TaxID=1954381 RepID=UPI003BAAF5BE